MTGAPILALVCSVGGLEALRAVLEPLPPDFPAAIIALQHQSPEHHSYLAELLDRHCMLPVREACDGEQLRSGRVHVVPPGCHALVTVDDCLALIPAESFGYRPSADLLLASLAVVAPRRAIAVVLSGAGNDGAVGATAVHKLGGTVIAADEASSGCFAMPQAAIRRSGIVDQVVAVEAIPALLQTLVSTSSQAR
jgi:two-component system chemotaxis response regulator CheB